MAKFREECKKWINCIQTLTLENINVTNLQNINQDDESNKYLFKVLLHLSHCADKCYKEKLSKESHIYRITLAICENLKILPDKDKFFSALYYVICYLLSGKCLKEAKVISEFLLTEKIFIVNDNQDSLKCHQLSVLWQTELFKRLDTWSSKSITKKAEIDDKFIDFVKFHLKIINYCNEKYYYTFTTAHTYIKKLTKVPSDNAFPCVIQIFEHMSNYIQNMKKISIIDAYNMLIIVMGYAFLERNDIKNNPKIMNYFLKCDGYFYKSFASIPQCNDCYSLFKGCCINLFEIYFAKEQVDSTRFENVRATLRDLLVKYGDKNNSLIQTAAAVSSSFEPLFSHWESLVSSQLTNTNLTFDDIVKMGNFVKYVHNILLNREHSTTYVCKQCSGSKKCLVKRELYHASVATATYIKVLTRANANNFNEKMFSVAKELLELIVSAYNELEALGCKYSSILWETCGRLIFNIGLISENKYAAQLEGLYETLCKQIVRHDGLEAKVSSFGLENPVGTSLHRLCIVYANQGKYRQAMTYAAYNALLSVFEPRKKKACDMWASIKRKLIDLDESKELQELTMSMCLKTDVDVVKKLGINVNLNNYDLDEFYLHELKSLYVQRNDVYDIMKKSLDELESTNNSIAFAQGTLLLCFHALKLIKRDHMTDYIVKAIERMKKCKRSTNTTNVQRQCLLANLNFFSIVEKLHVRSQMIDKQMDDVNFTIKAFKTLKINEAASSMVETDEITVPTFSGISIEEDNKLANELREVLALWERCMMTDMNAITIGWEPNLTLESIVICGEYCRLFKFNTIEEKSWKLAHEFATTIKDFDTCTYVTSRSLSLKCINDTWLDNAKKYVESIENSNKSTDIDTAALFLLSLADFYFDCKKIDEAKKLLDKVKLLINFSLTGNVKLYIYLVDIQFRNYFTIYSPTSQESYCSLIVEIHYILINSYEMTTNILGNVRSWNIRYHMIANELMFESLSVLVIPMNNLLSYRDVSLHLTYTLKCAQKMGVSLRIAEILKYLCYIDLLRSQIDSCETHLQDLEHVLCLDNFQLSSMTKIESGNTTSPDQHNPKKQKVRDAGKVEPVSLPKNSASPELKKKTFRTPAFFEHTRFCQCFYCTNLCYQYLTFSYSHIQAQLFSLLKYVTEAEYYFHGACTIMKRIDEKHTDESRQYQNYQWKRPQKYMVDYMIYLLDFSMFITEFIPDLKEDALNLIEESQRIAASNDLSQHSTTCYATELYAQYYVYETLQNKLNVYVPQDTVIDITNEQPENCITPKVQIEKITRNPRRRKSPPLIALPVITISDSSDIEVDSPIPSDSGSSSAGSVETKAKKILKRTSARNVRRKILSDELDESPTVEEKEKKESKIIRKQSTRKVFVDELKENTEELAKDESKVSAIRKHRKIFADELNESPPSKTKVVEEPKIVSKKSLRKPLTKGLDENFSVKDEVKEESKIESKRSSRLAKKSTK